MANGSNFRTGWTAGLTKLALVTLVFETVTGLLITLAPFHAAVEWNVLLHTAIGLLTLVPLTWYFVVHWLDYKRFALSDVVLLGYVAVAALLVTSVSGLVVDLAGPLRPAHVGRVAQRPPGLDPGGPGRLGAPCAPGLRAGAPEGGGRGAGPHG